MCTVNGEDCDVWEAGLSNTATVMAIRSDDEVEQLCKKCRKHIVSISLKGKNGYCEACFLTMTIHKFRATLGKSKLVRQDDNILVGHSGKANSTALLHLVSSCANESITKKLSYRCKVLYIDDGLVKGRTVKQRESILRSVADQVRNFGLTGYMVSLHNCLDEKILEDQPIQPMDMIETQVFDQASDVLGIFENLKDDTAKDELLRRSRCRILVSAAKKLGCTKVFLADTSVDLAVKVLGDISTGRGAQLTPDIAFFDTVCSDVTLLRPLREFTGEEVTNYLDCYHLIPVLSCRMPFGLASIRNAAREFVCRLDNEFHSTVSTIYRTSDKLAGRTRGTKNLTDEESCVVCDATIVKPSTTDEQLCAVQARIFSVLASVGANPSPYLPLNAIQSLSAEEQRNRTACGQRSVSNDEEENKRRCQCGDGPCAGSHFERLQFDEMDRYLCYSCKYTFSTSNSNSNSNAEMLPTFIENAIQRRLRLTKMRKEITDFLL